MARLMECLRKRAADAFCAARECDEKVDYWLIEKAKGMTARVKRLAAKGRRA